MAPPAWAYQVDYFDPTPDDELICSICRAVFCEPVQCGCNHVFCRACIGKWLESNRNCPICRQRTSRYSLQEVIPLIKNMILKLQMRCHNSEQGCVERFSLEACENHERDCAYELVRCRNMPCKEKCLRKDIQDHELFKCQHHYIRCKHCDLKISTKITAKHNCLQALKRSLKVKIQIIKNKNRKIQELQSEVKSLRENDRDTSDILDSSDSSASFVGLEPETDENSLSSLGTSELIESYDFDNVASWIVESSSDHTRSSPQGSLDRAEDSNHSIEFPRTSTPAADNIFSVTAQSPSDCDDEPPLRRSTKRRLTARIIDSSDDEQNLETSERSMPSPKRFWSFSSSPAGDDSLAGPSTNQPNSVSEDTNDETGVSFRLRPRLNNRAVTSSTAPPAQRGTFEATLAMLEQYNLESDPEWCPQTNGSARSDMGSSDCSISITESDLSLASDSSEDIEYELYEERISGRAALQESSSDTDDEEWQPDAL